MKKNQQAFVADYEFSAELCAILLHAQTFNDQPVPFAITINHEQTKPTFG
jgi:hypothetical protein